MEIKLEQLPHQIAAVEAVCKVFEGAAIRPDLAKPSQNPSFSLSDPKIWDNIIRIQNGLIPKDMQGKVSDGVLGIDVKMETGTGKTYTFTRLMYELNQRYGFFKFILLAPTVSIREGTKNFIQSEYARRHFNRMYSGYFLDLQVLEAQRRTGSRKNFPSAVSNFARGTMQAKHQIDAMLTSGHMLLSRGTMGEEYDQTINGEYTVPYKAIAATRPIVILDEPHRFKRGDKAYQAILEELNPLCVIRFGATFPEEGTGKNKHTDYNNLVYNLNAIEAFNDNLVKGVVVQNLQKVGKDETKIKLMKVAKGREATFRNEETKESILIRTGDDLSIFGSEFGGITLEGVGRRVGPVPQCAMLSNGHLLHSGDSMYGSVYGETYQELMLKQALRAHFQQEKENFLRPNRIKTLTLFFIDDIQSYRDTEEKESKGHLRQSFESMLTQMLKEEIAQLEEQGLYSELAEYKEYLKASLADVGGTNGGYFSKDNDSSDEAIQEEVDNILRDKATLLSFKNSEGKWNTRRFIFSKWTLREGWDNPNIFTIAKLRSSGSETSKLQEVGRGLRLPVDEFGNRLSKEQFYLTVLLDFTEEDFVQKLIGEIESQGAAIRSIKSLLESVAKEMNMEENALAGELLSKGYINLDYEVIPHTREEFLAEYPLFQRGLNDGKVSKDNKPVVNIRHERFEEIRSLWEDINQKYMVKLDNVSTEELEKAVKDILEKNKIFGSEFIRVQQKRLVVEDGQLEIESSIAHSYEVDSRIPYGEYLEDIGRITLLPIDLVHQSLVEFNRKYRSTQPLLDKDFNSRSLRNFITCYRQWFEETFYQRFHYEKVSVSSKKTALTDSEGKVYSSISQNDLGLFKVAEGLVPSKFLYDSIIYDSDIERRAIEGSIGREITVFGKIPRRSIRIPLYSGGTTSPDFMYLLKHPDDTITVGLVVESKGVEKRSDIRGTENIAMKSARVFFQNLETEGYSVKFEEMYNDDKIEYLINSTLPSPIDI